MLQNPIVESRPVRVKAEGQLIEDTGLLADVPGLHSDQRQLRDSWPVSLEPGALQVHVHPGVDRSHFHAYSLPQNSRYLNRQNVHRRLLL